MAALPTAGTSGRASHVFHAVAVGTPSEVCTLARDFTVEEWERELSRLRDRGLVDGDALTEHGRDLHELLRPMTAAVVRR